MIRSKRRFSFHLHSLALLLATLFFCTGLLYSLHIPIFEASDEPKHFAYVKYLADGFGLPIAGQSPMLKQAATQGPLYYALVALLTWGIDTDNVGALLEPNPHWSATAVRPLHDNQNRFVATPDGRFPYIGAARAVLVGRVISLVFGAVTVACTVLIAHQFFPNACWLAGGAGALVAFNPQFIRTSATVSNDAASTALVALLALLALKWRMQGWDASITIGLGLLAGLALLTKLNAMVGCGLVVLVLLLWKPPQLKWHQQLKNVGLFALTIILVAGWWFWRNYALYGEWTASDVHLNLAGRAYLSLTEMMAQRLEIERTFWAAFGWGQIRVADWHYTLLRYGRYFATFGLVFFIIRNRSSDNLKLLLFFTLWLGASVILYARWVSLVGSVSHARLLFPALPAIALLGLLGLGQWLPANKNWREIGALGLAGVMVLFALSSLFFYIVPAYRPPQPIQAEAVPPHLPLINLTYGDSLRLIAVETPDQRLEPGHTADLYLYWQLIAPMSRNYSIFLRLYDHNQTVVAQRDTYPGLGLFPTKYWQPGHIIRDHYPVTVPATLENLPLLTSLVVGVYDYHAAGYPSLAVVNENGEDVYPTVEQVKLVPQTWPKITPEYLINATFADNIHLVGYDWHCQAQCQLRLYWAPTGTPAKSYTVFIHHIKADGQRDGYDQRPKSGAYPTNYWTVDEMIVDDHLLPSISTGYLLVGLYHWETGERLPIKSVVQGPAPIDQAIHIQVALE